jgi:Arc/MetJ family transcription regulator
MYTRVMVWNSTRCNSFFQHVDAVSQRPGTGNCPPFFVAQRLLALHVMCKTIHMPTNLAIDDKLIEEARRRGGHRTKKGAVTTALEEYIRRHKPQRILAALDF